MKLTANDRVKSLQKGLELLLLLSDHKTGLSLEEITQRSGYNKTTCFRLLKTMQELDFVDQEPGTKHYRLGPRNIALGTAAMDRLNLRNLALPLMRQLKETLDETINLAVLSGPEIVFVERLEAKHIVSAHHQIGDRLPAYCTSMGKAILAHLPEARLNRVLERTAFESKTPLTVTDVQLLRAELARVREEGLAYNREELEKGLCAVAAPILDHNGRAVAALNVAFTLVRHDLNQALEKFTPQVRRTGQELSALLGFRRDRPGGEMAEERD